MPKPTYAGVVLDVEPGKTRNDAAPEPDSPFHILILGDFSGRASRGVTEPVSGRRPVLVDRDEIETLPKRLRTEIRVPLEGGHGAELLLPIESVEDFHPDSLLEKCALFPALRAMRRKLENPAALKAATDEILGGLAREAPREAQASAEILTGSLLDQIAEESAAPPQAKGARPRDPLLAYIHDLVAPHLTPGEDPKQKELLAQLDAELGAQMRRLLHHPSFQAAEASWRALDYLVRNVETDTQLKVYILDVSKPELLADLASASDLKQTGLFQILVKATPGGEPWALLGADCTFRPWIDDIELLARVAMLADQAGAPVITAGDTTILGVKDPARLGDYEDWQLDNPVWNELRGFPEARRVGMAMPRFLLRVPYGKASSPAERFPFEEMPEGSTHANYLWGNPMYACVMLIAQAFSHSKWQLRPGQFQGIRQLPVHVWHEYGNPEVKPCAEVLLTLKAAESMIEQGLMPLLSMKGTDEVRVGMFQSIAKPPTPLEGRWS